MKRIVVTLVLFFVICGRSLAQEKPYINIEEAVGIAKKEVPGTVLKAEFEDGVYEIKIRTDNGERIKLKIDPKDGSIIRKGKIVKELIKGLSKPEAKEVQR